MKIIKKQVALDCKVQHDTTKLPYFYYCFTIIILKRALVYIIQTKETL
jgi:hypothetical protein